MLLCFVCKKDTSRSPLQNLTKFSTVEMSESLHFLYDSQSWVNFPSCDINADQLILAFEDLALNRGFVKFCALPNDITALSITTDAAIA